MYTIKDLRKEEKDKFIEALTNEYAHSIFENVKNQSDYYSNRCEATYLNELEKLGYFDDDNNIEELEEEKSRVCLYNRRIDELRCTIEMYENFIRELNPDKRFINDFFDKLKMSDNKDKWPIRNFYYFLKK